MDPRPGARRRELAASDPPRARGPNFKVGPYTVDFLWRDARLVVETDCAASHDRPTQRERDRRRDAWLGKAGYRTKRFTWQEVTNSPGEVLATLRSLL